MIDHNPDHLDFLPPTFEHEYLDLLRRIMAHGEDRADRTGTGTRAVFGEKLTINLLDGFPLLTTKKMPFKAVASELLWFIEGSGDERRLAEILHGTRDPMKKTIWSPNAAGTTGAKYVPKFPGDLGRVYGVQWRNWLSTQIIEYDDYLHHDENASTYFGAKVQQTRVDQLADVVNKLRTNPTDRRIIMSAWNPGELHLMALPPCHMFAQFYLSNNNKLSCQMYMRSIDTFLGLPFNIASYALLTYLIAHSIGADLGNLHMVLGDTHIYKDHFDQVREQLGRYVRTPPILQFQTDRLEFDGYKMDDFNLMGYDPHPAIAARMSA
jgi:thymidylate synthase